MWFSAPLWSLQIEALKLFTREDLVSWFLDQRNNSRKLSVHVSVHVSVRSVTKHARCASASETVTELRLVGQVVGFGRKENDPAGDSGHSPASSAYGEVRELTFLPACSPSLQDATLITDIRAFTSSLHLHPYHKILT